MVSVDGAELSVVQPTHKYDLRRKQLPSFDKEEQIAPLPAKRSRRTKTQTTTSTKGNDAPL